ncbi:hypothetical protein LIER_41914 [Lithospermum erythrorhizon]|uniref:Reverse transcriptase n=1 Tax=Lithospermum erythrorhizon TaxID=34254 RepID=A0AAV3RHV2_LITER
MAIGKCPSPNGLSVEFYKFYWEEVGKEVYEAFLHIFATGEILAVLNATTISLIPKTEHPSSVTEYRPISCCNIFYKAITRVLMNRMRPLRRGLISLSQLAFIIGRSLGDSVLML